MTDDNVPTIGLNDVLGTRYGNTITGTFVSANKIALSAYRPILSTTRDEPTEYAGKDPVYIHLIQQEFLYHDSILRGLIAEANSTFVALQSIKQPAGKAVYTNISLAYRSIIRGCLEKLEDKSSDAAMRCNEDAFKSYRELILIFYSIESVWHLFEIMLLHQLSSNSIASGLLHWIRFHFPQAERNATDLMMEGHEASDNESFWPTVKSLIRLGQIDVTRAILKLHPSSLSNAFKTADDILKTIPIFRDGMPIEKFRSQREYWLTETERKLSANMLSGESKLEELMQLVIGDKEAWNAELVNSLTWYEYLPGYLFYTHPACEYYELGDIANAWLNRWIRHRSNRELKLKRLDYILLNLMDNNFKSAINSVQVMPDNQWFATHLIDLLYNSGQLKAIYDSDISECKRIRESLLYEFGCGLMTRDGLWHFGIDYLECCPEQGKATIEHLLTRITIRSEKQAFKIISIARQKGFESVEAEICKVQSRHSFANKRYGNALEWAIRSKDTIYITNVADFLLKYFKKNGEPLCPEVIANIGAKMFLSPRLIFLVKYFDFYELYRRREFLPAAKLLINLLESKITPYYFWPCLLIDTIPLLESKDPKIFTKETSSILQLIEFELKPIIERKRKLQEMKPDEKFDILQDYRIENIEEILSLLRLACARNLARATIIENTQTVN